ncbi:MAG: 6-phosphofructokinase, partial [Lentisphaerae bacterium]|nr:6-phosphofructokinase [Lentisphaerota bacterium]
VLDCAHNESKGAPNGIGLVKLMGRDSGFIAAAATLASQEVNFTIIPEVPLKLDGPKGFLNILRQRILARQHAVVVVAEGAGQDLLPQGKDVYDASGNKLHQDIGLYLRDRIIEYFRRENTPVNLKYQEPGYFIRSVPANSEDSLLCDQYGRSAVHAAMAGKTDMVVGFWSGYFMHVPIPMAVASRRKVCPENSLWTSVIAATGQPRRWE